MKAHNLSLLHHTLALLTLLAILQQPALAIYKCNPKLLRTFRLQGLKYSVSEEMEICPTVRDTCCSIMDQVRIMELWKKTSHPRIKTHIEKMKKWDHKVLGLHAKFRKLKKEDMVFFFKREKMLPFNIRYCGMNNRNRDYTPAEKTENMNWMLPGQGKIREFDQKRARSRAWKQMKSGYNKDTPLYRFSMDSTKLFYQEFRWIGRVMYYTNELPYTHQKFITARDRVKTLKFGAKKPPKLKKTKRKKVKSRSFRKKAKKQKFYNFVNSNDKRTNNEVQILYGNRKRIKERIKYGKRRRKKRKKRLKQKRKYKRYKAAMKQMKRKKKKRKKKKKGGRELMNGRLGLHLYDETQGPAVANSPQKRELNDADQAKNKGGDGGKAGKIQVDKQDYGKEPIEVIKIRRRKTRISYGAKAKGKAGKSRKWVMENQRKLRKRHQKRNRRAIHRKRKLKIENIKLGVKIPQIKLRGKHLRRRVHKLKIKHKREQRKLNNLKDQIGTQWNNLFNNPAHPVPNQMQALPPTPNRVIQIPNAQAAANYSPQQLAQIAQNAQMQQGNNTPQNVMIPQQMQNNAQTTQPGPAGQGYSQSPGEQGQIQYQNMQYSSQPGQQPVALTPQGYQSMGGGAYPWNQMYAMQQQKMQQMQQQQMQQQQMQTGIKSGRILEEIRETPVTQDIPHTDPHKERALRASDKELLQKFKVTSQALEAMKALRFKYGKKLYKKHLNEVQKKTKYFSDFVLKGDPVTRLTALNQKLKKAVKLIKKKGNRKLFFKKAASFLFGAPKSKKKGSRHSPGLFERGIMVTKFLAAFIGMDSSKEAPSLNKLLRIIKYPKWPKFFKEDLKIKHLNDFLFKHGVKKLDEMIKQKFKSMAFIIQGKWKIENMLSINKNFMKNLRIVIRDREKARRAVKKLEKKIKKCKKRLQKAIDKNNENFEKYQASLVIAGDGPKPKDEDIVKTKIEVDLDVTFFPQQPTIECGVDFRHFPYSEVNYSKRKERFCLRTWRRFKRIDVTELIEYVELSRDELRTIMDLKKAMYCGVCDGTLQNNFDEDRKLILYSQRFCHDLVSQFEDYIRFRNIILINYYEEILQMMNCFEFSNKGGANFPVKTMLQKQKRRIKSIEMCFKHLRTPSFYKHCYWVCSQFNIMKFNSFFDGDPEMLKTIYMRFNMFMRKYKQFRRKVDGHRIEKKRRRKRRRKRRKRKNRGLRYRGRPDLQQLKVQQVGQDGLVKGSPVTFKQQDKRFQADSGKDQNTLSNKGSLDGGNTANSKLSLQLNNHYLKNKQVVKKKKRKKRKRSKDDQMSIADQISTLILKHRKKAIKKTQIPDREKALRDYRQGIKNKKIISTIHVPTAKEIGIYEDQPAKAKSAKKKKKNKKKKQRKTLEVDSVPSTPTKTLETKPTILKKNKSPLSPDPKKKKANRRKLKIKTRKSKTTPKTQRTTSKSSKNKPSNGRILTSIEEIFSDDIQNELLEQRLQNQEADHPTNSSVFLTSPHHHSSDRSLHPKPEGRFGPKREEMVAVPKRKLKPHEIIKRRISYLTLHTESDNLPRYNNYNINTSLNPAYRDVLQQQPIYHQTYLPMEIQNFRPFFTFSIHGFNPLRAQELMKMDFKPQQIVRLTKRTNYKTEKLTRLAVLQYIGLSRDDMASFNNDFKLKVNPLHHTDYKSYHNTPPWPRWKLHNRFKKFQREYGNEKGEHFKGEFDNPDMYHLRGHYRNNTSNDHVAKLWFHMFGKH